MTTAPRFFITGANGQLGRLVVAALAQRVAPESIVAIVRRPEAAQQLFPAGVVVRHGDYAQPATLNTALAGVDRLLFIASNAIGQRDQQHQNVIAAAQRSGAKRIIYTSTVNADSALYGLAQEHRQTEADLRNSGMPFIVLRNSYYMENHTSTIPIALQHGAIIGASGEGRISAAPRRDYAEAAVASLLDDAEHTHTIYELGGDEAYTMAEFAAELSRQTGRQIPFVNMPAEQYAAALVGAGLPQFLAEVLAETDLATQQGALFNDSRTLSRLIGRPTTPLADVIHEVLVAKDAFKL